MARKDVFRLSTLLCEAVRENGLIINDSAAAAELFYTRGNGKWRVTWKETVKYCTHCPDTDKGTDTN